MSLRASQYLMGLILLLGWYSSHAQCVMTFDDEAAFLAMTSSPDMESFEGLPNDPTTTWPNAQLVLPGFTIDAANMGVYNTPYFGRFATDGSQYIDFNAAGTPTITFNFDNPKNAFGINITDWGEFGNGSLTFMNDAGDFYVVAVTPQPEGGQLFYGVINYDFQFTQVVFEDNSGSGLFGFDEVYCENITPPARVMACKNVNVSLNEECYIQITPATVLSGFFPCYDDFIVELEYHGKALGDTLFQEHVGLTVKAKVTDTTTGNSCWAEILVEDKFSPNVLCRDTTINCLEYRMYYDTPGVVEQCQLYEIRKVDEQITSLSCDPLFIKEIVQTFVAVDESGNESAPCSRTIMIERFPLSDVVCPDSDTTLYCEDTFRTDANGHPHPDVTGAPTVGGLSLYPQPDFFCNLWVDYTDYDLGKVGCTRKIMRTWKVEEWWCTRDTSRTCTQFIYITDTLGPEVAFPVDSVYAKTNIGFHTCEGDVWIPQPFFQDACNGEDRLDLIFTGGFIENWQGEKITLPTGFHTVYVRGYDSCYNNTLDSVIVHVQDKIAPIAVCDQNTQLALDNDGIIHAYAEVFDDGSFDECVIKEMAVRRMDDACGGGTDEWGEYVEFCCDDVGNEVMVSFRVTDKSGNSGTCMVTALIVDKIPPRVTCPPDITVDCRFDWDPNNLDVFGSIVLADSLRKDIVIDSDTVMFDGPAIDGVAYDNCPMIVLDSMSMDSIDQCGEGILRRYFQVEDAQGQMSPLCVQRITFVNPRPFNELDIIWPRDIDTVNLCSDAFFNPDFLDEEFAYPRYRYEAECSLVGQTYKDHVIDNTGGARGCFKILRKWKVIDWCQFNGREFEAWEHEQVILVENNRPPVISTDCADTVHCFFTNDCIAPPITLTENALDDCTPRDQLFWTYKIDLGNDGSFDDEQSGSNTLTRSFAADTHRIKWIVEDLCGNEATCEYTFELRNCKAPIAYCKPGAILELTPMDLDGDGTPDTEMAELWASDLDDGSSHECGYGVTFSFSPDTSDNVRWYDCDSIGLRTVRIYVTDLTNGNQSVCITSVTIQDNNNVNVCPQTLNGSIAGLVADREGRAVALAEVTLPGTNMPMEMTGTSGAYTFKDMPFGGSYNVEVHKDDDYLNGVTTGDLVRMQRHLLGMNTFDEPWQHIAGDVNFSGEVTAADIADVRKVILGVKEKFVSERSWRFIDGEYIFQDPTDPLKEVLPEVIEISSFDDDVMNNWKGVKLGDIDNSADPQGFGGISSRSAVALHYEDAVVDKYDEFNMVITADHLDMVDAVQFTLEVDNDYFEIVEVIPVQDGMHYAHFNQSMQHLGILSVSWDNIYGTDVKDLFIVKLRAVRNAELSDAVVMTNSVTEAIATVDETDLGLQLKAVGATGADAGDVVLYQNEPNPWSTSTELSFFLPERRAVQLSIIDANGRVVWTLDREYSKGFHEVTIDKGDLKASGVYYYQIQTGDFIASKKMLIL